MHAAIAISAQAEWAVVRAAHRDAALEYTPWGEAFARVIDAGGRALPVVFFHGGWGKVAAAGSTQYAIARWKPRYLVNLGTCGGFGDSIERYTILLFERTIIYDIQEAMGDAAEAIAAYTTTLDLSWLRGTDPSSVRRSLLLSADRDLRPTELAELSARYRAIAADWESGAIAYICQRNHQRALILRGVSDLVHPTGASAYGNMAHFEEGTERVMQKLLADLPLWLARCPD